MLYKIQVLSRESEIEYVRSLAKDFSEIKTPIKSCLEIKGFATQVMDELIDESDHPSTTLSNYRSGYTYKEYLPGNGYGFHSDEVVNADGKRLDVSTTLFLNDDYDGGELELLFGDFSVNVKLPAGWAVVYPTGLIHRVKPVQSGTRQVVHWWDQSNVQNPFIRDAIVNLTGNTADDNYISQLERFC